MSEFSNQFIKEDLENFAVGLFKTYNVQEPKVLEEYFVNYANFGFIFKVNNHIFKAYMPYQKLDVDLYQVPHNVNWTLVHTNEQGVSTEYINAFKTISDFIDKVDDICPLL